MTETICFCVAYCVTVVCGTVALLAHLGWQPILNQYITQHYYPEPEDDLSDMLRRN